ncbi:MAG: hypothetical protein AAF561_09900 [Planctomycetota bacterium]
MKPRLLVPIVTLTAAIMISVGVFTLRSDAPNAESENELSEARQQIPAVRRGSASVALLDANGQPLSAEMPIEIRLVSPTFVFELTESIPDEPAQTSGVDHAALPTDEQLKPDAAADVYERSATLAFANADISGHRFVLPADDDVRAAVVERHRHLMDVWTTKRTVAIPPHGRVDWTGYAGTYELTIEGMSSPRWSVQLPAVEHVTADLTPTVDESTSSTIE